MTNYDALAAHYAAERLGYSNDLYNTLLGFGLTPRDHVLDVCCGTGLGSRPLIENGFRVTGLDNSKGMLEKARAQLPAATWTEGSALAMPFEPRTFDAAISAQAFHRFEDKAKALAELARVLKPRGIVAIWWKVLMSDDPVKILRDTIAHELGKQPAPEGLTGGFKDFYAASLTDQTLRVVPWRVTMTLRDYMQYERSRMTVVEALHDKAGAYFNELEKRLRQRYGQDDLLMPLSYMQFAYLARTPAA